MIWGGVFIFPNTLDRAKILYYSGKILNAFEILSNLSIEKMNFEEKKWFGRINSELGNHKRANEILLSLSPLKNQKELGVLFLRNLYRWQLCSQAILYIDKFDLSTPSFYEVCGDIYLAKRKYEEATAYYIQAYEIGDRKDYILYKLAKVYYLNKDKKNTKKCLDMALKITKSRMLKINLVKFGELL